MTEKLVRPELFVPISVRFMTGQTGCRLLDKFGRDGPLVWVCLLAACKLNRPAGEITWASESEAWNKLGLTGFEPDFTFDAFLKETGRMKLTRRRNVSKTRSGHVQDVIITVWERWHNANKTEAARARKARSRAHSERDIERDSNVTAAGQVRDLEVDTERESDTETEPEPVPVVELPEVPPVDIDTIDWDTPSGHGTGAGIHELTILRDIA